MKLFDCNHFAHVIVLWQMQKFMCYCTVFALLILNLREISKYKPRVAYIRRGDLTEGFFCVMSLGGLYLEGLIFGISRNTSARTWNLAPNFLKKTGFWRGHFWTSSLSDKNHFFAMSWKRLLIVVALCETCDQALFFRGKGGKSTRLPNKNGRKTA